MIEQDQLGGLAHGDLPAQFGADRPAGPGDQHAFALIGIAHPRQFRLEMVAPQELGEIQWLGAGAVAVIQQHLRKRRHDVHFAGQMAEAACDARLVGLAGGGHGQDDPVDPQLFDK